MLQYQAHLADRPVALLHIHCAPVAGDAIGYQTYRVSIWFAAAGGRVLRHHGTLWAPAGGGLKVIGVQMIGSTVLVSLGRPTGRTAPADAPQARTYQVWIPIQVPGQGAGPLGEIAYRLRAAADGAGQVVGRLVLQIGRVRLRVPFALITGAGPGDWVCAGALTSLRLARANGRLTGQLGLTISLASGAGEGWSPYGPPTAVRDLAAQVAKLGVQPAGPAAALVEGRLATDLYWSDRDGVSRWSGGSAPFSRLVDLPGYQPETDRLEVGAAVEAVARGGLAARQVEARVTVRLTVAAYRPCLVPGAANQLYRVEQLVAARQEELDLNVTALRYPPGHGRPVPQRQAVSEEQLTIGPMGPSPVQSVCDVPVPGPVNRVLSVRPHSGGLGFLIQCDGCGLRFVPAAVPDRRPLAVWSWEAEGEWHLRICAASQS